MALEPGTRLGPYEITGWLGAGGMGEVYRARDTKLGREVAIKTLPAALASDMHRLARFEREAQLLAALNHPHIAAIHALAEHDGTRYLAMELVEGRSLAQLVAAGAMSIDESLRLALQIAEALEAAHGKGVVHRDLKPGNVMLTRDGQVKVLDFGLAKALTGERGEATLVHSPASLAMTQQGFVLGTAGYMSPEQASGQDIDQRADIWAFGVVLYEMLTGTPLFQGESVPHVIADVLKTEPDWSRLPKNLSPRARTLLERCLTKKPRNRLHAIADARIEIEAVLANPAAADAEASRGRGPANAPVLAAALGLTAVAAAAAGWFLRPEAAVEPGVVARFSQPLPEGFLIVPSSNVAVSRDGTRIAYVAERQLYLRDLAETEARPIAGTLEQTDATSPTFSPDGQWLAYVRVVSPLGPYFVERIPVDGGTPVPIYTGETPAAFPNGLSWPTADALLFATAEGVVRLSANGSAREVLVAAATDEALLSAQLLPDGDSVLFTRVSAGSRTLDTAQIAVQSIGRQDRKVVLEGGSAARSVPSGHLLFAKGTALFAIAFDAEARAVNGVAVPVAQDLPRSGGAFSDAANFDVSETGTLALIRGPVTRIEIAAPRRETTLTWVDRNGREEPLPGLRPDEYTMARLSPDGMRLALVIGGAVNRAARPSLGIFDFRTQNLSLLATDPAIADGPVWSLDGNRIFFRGFRANELVSGSSVYSIDLATSEVTLLWAGNTRFPFAVPWAVTPDGQTLAVVDPGSLVEFKLATLSLGNQELAELLPGVGRQNQPSFSPDGEWVALMEQASAGAPEEINIRPFPAVARRSIPVARGDQPVLSRDGSELFFYDGRGIAAAPVSYEPELSIRTPRRLFESDDYMWGYFGRAWDPDASGQRFLMIRKPVEIPAATTPAASADDPEQARIDVVVNWFEELERNVPVPAR